MCTNGVCVDGIHALACGHEEAIALATSKADIGADFREVDLADSITIRCKDMDTVIACTNPSCTGPDVTVEIGAYAIGISRVVESIEFHGGEFPSLCESCLVNNVPDLDIFSVTGVGDV